MRLRPTVRWFSGWGTAMFTGGLFVLAMAATERGEFAPERVGAALVPGALYGLAVLAFLRLLRMRGWALPVAGLLCGPAPVLLFVLPEVATAKERGQLVLAGMIAGVLIGLLDWARESSRAARTRSRELEG